MGADPMLTNTPVWVFRNFHPEFATVLLNFGQPFLDINTKLPKGDSFLHGSVYNPQFAKIKHLVDKGIDIDALDDDGMTGLQQLLRLLRLIDSLWDELESIKYLIRHGANIRAICKGRSCSAIAYENKYNGSYAGDVWDAALAATGYNVQEFRDRESYPHRSRYIWPYTLEDFKFMWQGIEDRCPYYEEATRLNDEIEDRYDMPTLEELESGESGSDQSDSEWETESESCTESDSEDTS